MIALPRKDRTAATRRRGEDCKYPGHDERRIARLGLPVRL
jgi:hypothetical protein